jgi:hypothetical protein
MHGLYEENSNIQNLPSFLPGGEIKTGTLLLPSTNIALFTTSDVLRFFNTMLELLWWPDAWLGV